MTLDRRLQDPADGADLPSVGSDPGRPGRSAGLLRAAAATTAPVAAAVLALAGLLVPVPLPVATASATASAAVTPPGGGPSAGDPMGSRVADARAAAEAAARQVDVLRAEYLSRNAQAVAAARRLSATFAELARLDGGHDRDAAALARAEASRAASIRAVYADGGRLGLLGSVLTARSPDDALWRLGTVRRIQAQVLGDEQRRTVAAAADEARSQQDAEDSARLSVQLSRALAEMQDRLSAADQALQRAQAELDRLAADARRLAVAQEAARRLAAARAQAQQARLTGAPAVAALPIPPDYETAYRAAAATCPGLDWTLLAAVGQIESGHGRNNGPSTAGAIGPMQFMPATFAAYAVDGDGDGVTDAWDFHDAIPTAAAYLCASGARSGTADGVRAALFAYNHAQWYVDLVLAAQRAILAAAAR